MSKKAASSTPKLFERWTFTKKNYLVFGIGLLMIITGYVVMATGKVNSVQALTIAPILLFLGYVIVIPAALIYRDKSALPSRERETSDT